MAQGRTQTGGLRRHAKGWAAHAQSRYFEFTREHAYARNGKSTGTFQATTMATLHRLPYLSLGLDAVRSQFLHEALHLFLQSIRRLSKVERHQPAGKIMRGDSRRFQMSVATACIGNPTGSILPVLTVCGIPGRYVDRSGRYPFTQVQTHSPYSYLSYRRPGRVSVPGLVCACTA